MTKAGENGAACDQDMLRARFRDPAAFGRLLAGFRGYLLAIAHGELDSELRHRLGPSDLVQDTFVHAQKAVANFGGTTEAELQAWLAQILRRRCSDLRDAHLGSDKRDPRRERSLERGPLARLRGEDQTPSENAIAEEEATRLMLALERLPKDMRDVIWLRNWQSLSFEEIGARMDKSEEAARKLFARGVKQLARKLDEGNGAGKP